MTTVVADCSALVAAMVDDGVLGEWSRDEIVGNELVAPEHCGFEIAEALRNLERAGVIERTVAALAFSDFVDFEVATWPLALLAPRVWQLRGRVTSYDAGYVALAELLDARLVTLDVQLGRTTDLKCVIHTPSTSVIAESRKIVD